MFFVYLGWMVFGRFWVLRQVNPDGHNPVGYIEMVLTYPLHPHWDIRLRQCSSIGFCPSLPPAPCFARATSLLTPPFLSSIFGRPRFRFLDGGHLRVALGILSFRIFRTCSSHVNRLRLISRTALLQPVFLSSS